MRVIAKRLRNHDGHCISHVRATLWAPWALYPLESTGKTEEVLLEAKRTIAIYEPGRSTMEVFDGPRVRPMLSAPYVMVDAIEMKHCSEISNSESVPVV